MSATVQPEALLKELHNLWISLGGEAEGEKSSGVLRACAMTLIVAAEEVDDAVAIGETLAELMREHPSRAIVLRLRSGDEALLQARVFAQCWLPLGQRRQICSEQIEITVSQGSLADVPSIVRAITVPDLPVVVWCRCQSLFRSDRFRELSMLAGRIIIDSLRSGAMRDTLARLSEELRSGRIVSDLAWTRLTSWRECIAQAFEDPIIRPALQEMQSARVGHAAGTPAAALYMAAWLSVCLGWSPDDPRLVLQPAGEDQDNGLQGVTLAAPGLEVLVQWTDGGALVLSVNGREHRRVHPELSDTALLGEELSIYGHDSVFEQALATASLIAQRAED